MHVRCFILFFMLPVVVKAQPGQAAVITELPREITGSQSDTFICGNGEMMPEAPFNIQAYLAANMHYPADAKNESIEGRVIVKFIVTKKGRINSVKVTKAVYPSLDAEAIRLAKAMPRWKPGSVKRKRIDVQYYLPVIFRLE